VLKYKTEKEFCEETTKLLIGLLIPDRKVIAVPEVPWGCFSNEQFDMMLLDVKNQEYLMIEYKLNGLDHLEHQVSRLQNAIGIINTKLQKESYSLFGYTGEDEQIERINKYGVGYKYRWNSIYHGFGMVYYWAFKDNKSDFSGGITGGGRMGFAAMYKQAIRNLHKKYGKLDFMITHAVLQSKYSVGTSRKYYRQAIK